MAAALRKIYLLLRTATDRDFSQYKRNTICRRIERRMSLQRIDDIDDYVRYLQDSKVELNILFKELLIGVTSFFRDPAAFELLKEKYLPELLQNKPDDYQVRVWVPGCSSGEEAYSIAIVLRECMEAMGRHFPVQIFGTDLDEDAVGVARAGRYPESIAADSHPGTADEVFRPGRKTMHGRQDHPGDGGLRHPGPYQGSALHQTRPALLPQSPHLFRSAAAG